MTIRDGDFKHSIECDVGLLSISFVPLGMVAHWLRSIYRRFLSEDALLCGGDKYLLHRSYANSVSPPHSGKTAFRTFQSAFVDHRLSE